MNKKIWYSPNGLEVYDEKEINAVVECLKKGWLSGTGEITIEFEKKISKYFGKEYGIFVNSGSSANLLAILSLELPEKSKVITPACTFNTTVAPIIQCNLEPVFIDVGYNSYISSIDDIEDILKKDISNEIKLILLPNLIGNKPDWKKLREVLINLKREDIILIEDSCDIMTYTKETDISTCSFYASHIITACGSGGIVMFNNKKYYNNALSYRDWGRNALDNSEYINDRYNETIDDIPYDSKFSYSRIGYNFKSSEVNTAFGLVQFDKLEKYIELRKRNFKRYIENLKDVKDLILPETKEDIYWLAFPLQYEKNRIELITFLENNNIQTRLLFSGNITRHPAYKNKYFKEFKISDKIMAKGFLLGCHQTMSLEDVDYICDKIKEFIYSPQ